MDDRRKFPRIEKSLVTYHRKLWQTSHQFAGISKNISLSGVLIELEDAQLKVGDLLSIELKLPTDDDEINVIGRITRKDKSAYGIEFVSANEKDIERLGRFLAPSAA